MDNTLITIIGVMGILIFALLIILIIKNNKLKSLKKCQSDYELLTADYERLKQIKDNYASAINLAEKRATNAEKQVETITALFNKVTDNPLKYLRFKTQNGEIVNTVKLKAVMKDKKVINMAATVRRNINKKYQDVKVTPLFDV